MGQCGPACLASVQRADSLIPQPHRTGRGTECSGCKGRRGASGTSHLSHAGHAVTGGGGQKTKTPPRITNTQAEMEDKLMRKGEVNRKKGVEKSGTETKEIFSRDPM